MENFILCAVYSYGWQTQVHLSKVKISFECGTLKEVDICNTLSSFNTITITFNSSFHVEFSYYLFSRGTLVSILMKKYFFSLKLQLSQIKKISMKFIKAACNLWKMSCSNSMVLLKSDTIHLGIFLGEGIFLHMVKLTLVECHMISHIHIFFFEKPHPIQ